jgi:RNA polymerase sigma-70 factor (ECF subfamily)
MSAWGEPGWPADVQNTAEHLLSVPTDEQLLAEHVVGEPGRFADLVCRHSDELFRFLARFLGNAAAAEDLVQEVFLQVHQSAASFDPTRRFKPWLFTIAANKARDLLRSRRRRPEMPLDAVVAGESSEGQTFLGFLADESLSPDGTVSLEEQREQVRKVLAEMPERLREVLVLSYYHGFPYKEIAEILDVPLGTVKSRLHSAIEVFGKAYRFAAKERG